MMSQRVMRIVLGTALLALNALAIGHPATERYIPIGYWSDVSDRDTYIGKIDAVNTARHGLSVSGEDGARAVDVTEHTRIFLDRSGLRQTNLDGTYKDCEVGRLVEVKFTEKGKSVAAWIKVRIER